MTAEMNIVEVQPNYYDHTERTVSNHDVAGWYVTSSDTDASNWTWNDRGNGPEVVTPEECYGPFPTPEAAEAWLAKFGQDD